MKRLSILLAIFGVGLGGTASAQNTFPSSGNVGIGTTSPGFPLDVNGLGRFSGNTQIGNGATVGLFNDTTNLALRAPGWPGDIYFQTIGGASTNMIIKNGGNVGIGVINPAARLDVYGASMSHTPSGTAAASGQFQAWAGGTTQGQRAVYSFYPTFEATGDNAPRRAADIVSGFNGGAWGAEFLAFNVGSNAGGNDAQNLTSEKLRILGNGNIGIGTANPTQKLSVNGTIRAKEVLVEASPWPDYVFDEGYQLAPLAEVEAQIKTEKHLSGIPSASEISEHGVRMGDMQAKLLSKIEELTLYVIELKKENAVLRSDMSAIQKSLK